MVDSHRIELESASLRVMVTPDVGGSITLAEHKQLGASVLGNVPWDTLDLPEPSTAAADEPTWLTRFTGGWPLLFPNAGEACEVDGIRHGFHGEASISAWKIAGRDAAGVKLTRRFFTVPVEMTRDIRVDDDVISVHETVTMHGSEPVSVIWGHHPTFGSDLLAGDIEIETGARRATVDADYDPPANPLPPGASGDWPTVTGPSGPCDLSRPRAPAAALSYLSDFADPWASIRRTDGTVGAVLSWDGAMFPCAWFWWELSGTPEPPWYGRCNLIGIEPNTTWPGVGLARSRSRSLPLLELQPGEQYSAWLRLHVFQPTGPVTGVDTAGRARMAAPTA